MYIFHERKELNNKQETKTFFVSFKGISNFQMSEIVSDREWDFKFQVIR